MDAPGGYLMFCNCCLHLAERTRGEICFIGFVVDGKVNSGIKSKFKVSKLFTGQGADPAEYLDCFDSKKWKVSHYLLTQGPFIPSHSFHNHLKLSNAGIKCLSNSSKEHFFGERKNWLPFQTSQWVSADSRSSFTGDTVRTAGGFSVLGALINNLFIWVFRFLTLLYQCAGDTGYLRTARKLQFACRRAAASIEDSEVVSLLFSLWSLWSYKEKGVWKY